MENKTKMLFSMGILFILMILHQIYFGNEGAIIIGGITLFSIGFGYYAMGTRYDEEMKTNSNSKKGDKPGGI